MVRADLLRKCSGSLRSGRCSLKHWEEEEEGGGLGLRKSRREGGRSGLRRGI